MAAEIADDAGDRRQAETGTAAGLGGEEGLEDPRLLLGHAVDVRFRVVVTGPTVLDFHGFDRAIGGRRGKQPEALPEPAPVCRSKPARAVAAG